MKRSPCLRWLPFSALLFAACAAGNYRADLAQNDVLYRDVEFRTKAPGDRKVFVAPCVDARDVAALPDHEGNFPIVYGGDEFWDRPVIDMVADVLVRQLADSGLFATVTDTASADVLVLQPSVVHFVAAAKQGLSGAASFAEVGLRLTVWGPSVGGGERQQLWEQTFTGANGSDFAVKPPSPYRLVGRALQQAMGRALAGLDGSNVGRSSVPINLPGAREASAPRR
ncbi:MAG: hypothetical protein JNN13_20125 [Planctomycetes bacterium]|nr:hypothetical protein [Planctomycetota bacterium]